MIKPIAGRLALAALAFALPGLAGADYKSAEETNNCAPVPENLRGDAENGQALHEEHCVACHGLTGAADVVVMHMD